MNMAFADGRYIDELERALYNNVLAGVSLEGDAYFYVNPLERFSYTRWGWHACPCCPPMFLKMMGALPSYIYAQDDSGVYINLFIGSRAETRIGNADVRVSMRTRYPRDGRVEVELEPDKREAFDVNIRIPGWAVGVENPAGLYGQSTRPSDEVVLKVNGKMVEVLRITRGYARLHRHWNKGDRIELTLPMAVRRVHSHARVEANVGRTALMRGPLVYCAESVDNNGSVRSLSIPQDAKLTAEYRADMLGGIDVVKGSVRTSLAAAPVVRTTELLAIPYYANANRDTKEMLVWFPEEPELAVALPSPSIASQSDVSVSFSNEGDDSHPPLKLRWHWDMGETPSALNDQIEPGHSADTSIPRHTWWGWEHSASKEWAQYKFSEHRQVDTVEIYWWDGSRIDRGRCRVPQSWNLFYRAQQEWKPVMATSEYGVQPDQYNRVTFEPVRTDALRVEVQLQPNYSAGILEWRVR
jgi:hypothetical protein